jgi:hypothetical protein
MKSLLNHTLAPHDEIANAAKLNGVKEQDENRNDLRRYCDVSVRLINTGQKYKVNTRGELLNL